MTKSKRRKTTTRRKTIQQKNKPSLTKPSNLKTTTQRNTIEQQKNLTNTQNNLSVKVADTVGEATTQSHALFLAAKVPAALEPLNTKDTIECNTLQGELHLAPMQEQETLISSSVVRASVKTEDTNTAIKTEQTPSTQQVAGLSNEELKKLFEDSVDIIWNVAEEVYKDGRDVIRRDFIQKVNSFIRKFHALRGARDSHDSLQPIEQHPGPRKKLAHMSVGTKPPKQET